MELDTKLLQGIPYKVNDCISYLQDQCGITFSVLARLQHTKFRRALTAFLVKNLVSDGISLCIKLMAGIQYCDILTNSQLKSKLEEALETLPRKEDDSNPHQENGPNCSGDEMMELLLQTAQALSYNPTRMTTE